MCCNERGDSSALSMEVDVVDVYSKLKVAAPPQETAEQNAS